MIEKVKRGYYHWTMGSGKGDVVIISRLFPDGILCMETALCKRPSKECSQPYRICENNESMEQSKELNRSMAVMPNIAAPL